MSLDLFTQPPRDQSQHVRQPAVHRQSDERVRIGLGDRDQARPDQGRDIVVGVVLGSRDEGLCQRCSRWPTGNRCSVEASTSRTRPEGSSLASVGELASQVSGQLDVRPAPMAVDRVDRQRVGQEPDGPRAYGFVFVPEQARAGRGRRSRRSRTANTERGSSGTDRGPARTGREGPPSLSAAARPGSIAPPERGAPCGRTIRSRCWCSATRSRSPSFDTSRPSARAGSP